MPIYTYESPNSVSRLANKLVVVDTSYLQDLSDPNEENFASVFAFHQQALANDTRFLLNEVVRQELLKLVRKTLLIGAMLVVSSRDSALEARYRFLTNIRTQPLSPQNLNTTYERICKDHSKRGDTHLLLNALSKDIWRGVQQHERQANITYASSGSAGVVTWDALGELMQNTGMASTDGMIADFAFTIGADAIVTTDSDYAPVEDLIDVYMPRRIADQCNDYNSAID
jgi:predicted nucleic acid-binding protein